MKILVISLAGIGDTLFATPLIHELRANFPEATIDTLVRWAGAKFLENNPHLNTVYQRDLAGESKASAMRFLLSLRRKGYDVSFNTHPQSNRLYRVAARVIGARIRISHEYECSGALDHWLVNQSIPQDYSRHAVENNLALLPFAGAKVLLPSHHYEIFLTAAEKTWAENFIVREKLSGKKLLGIHTGTGATKNLALRRWPLESYIELVRRLREAKPGLGVLFFGGPEEQRDYAQVQSALGADQVLFPKTENLLQAAALIAQCDSFLSVDSALMHVAAAMGVKNQVVIETPTWNKPIEPYGNPFTLVKNTAVAGRNLDYYRYDGGDIKGTREEILRTMTSVKVEDVFEALIKIW
ncbi:MAG TPA: glycosyltransferase family 9 protein [Pseudomonadales bacterium]|nr:glycosyltransferase family 9 protein [Pseudomonadales bacterium]